VVGQRGHVALHGLELLAHVLGLFDAIDRGRDECHHPPDRDQALAHLGGEVTLAADCDQDVGTALGNLDLPGTAIPASRTSQNMPIIPALAADAAKKTQAACGDREPASKLWNYGQFG